MADDDDDVRGGPGPEELLAPTGPRRSNFTPAPTDAESLEAANNVFNDDAIAAALAAELARVASGPIPVQPPSASTESAPAPQMPAPQMPVPEVPVPEVPALATAPETPATPEAPAAVPSAPAASDPTPEQVPTPEPVAATPPVERPVSPFAPVGPPDWATPLFGQPTTPARPDAAPSMEDPFAPNAPSFAPATGSFPPPVDLPGSAAPAATTFPAGTDPDALRELYRGAPAPTVPAADAPPPPGYEPTLPGPVDSNQGDLRPRRQSQDDDATVLPPPIESQPSETLSAIEQLQAQLHLREQEAREFATWESAMQAIGTPEALAEVERARAELTGSAPTSPSAPTVVESAATPPADQPPPPADQPAYDLTAPPAEEPVASLAPPADEAPLDLAPPAEEPAPDLAPPADEAPLDLAPPAEEPAPDLAPPADEAPLDLAPPADLAPPIAEPVFGFAPPADEPLVDLAPPAEEPLVPAAPPTDFAAPDLGAPTDDPFSIPPPPADENPFDAFARMAEERLANESTAEAPTELTSLDVNPAEQPPPPPLASENPFSGFAPPAIPDASSADTPVFLEPPALVEPPVPMEDPVAALYREAGDVPPPVTSVPPPPASVVPSVIPSPEPPAATPPGAPAPAATTTGPQGFEDLLSGSGDPNPPAPGAAWIAADPPQPPEAPGDEESGRRPFGKGVERDEAVDPSDSIFGKAPGPVSVNTAGVAIVPESVSLESRPIRVLRPPEEPVPDPLPELKRPPIVPAEPTGLEPTPLEQRVGRSARLFWLWFAANSSIVAIVFGTIIFALGVSLRQAIVATLAGVALSFIPLGLGTLAGKRSGQPTMVISRATFGVVGNILPALLALFSRLFWAAALLWILGVGTADILIGARLTDGFASSQLTMIAMSVFFVIAVVIAFFGYALIAVAQLVISVVSAITIAGFIALTVQYVNLGTALSAQDGPWILVVTGAVLVFSFVGLAWANSGPDVARYQRPGSSGAASMLFSTLGAAVPTFVLIGYGALLAASNLTLAENIAVNPLDSLGRLLPVWYPVPLLGSTVLSLLSGVVLAMYSGGFALQAVGLRLRRSVSTLLVGVLVIVIAICVSISTTDLTQLIRDFATTIAVPIAAWVGIFGAEVMIRKRPLDSESLLKRGGVYPDVRWGNLIALIGVSAIGYGFLSASAPGLGWEGYGFTALGIPLSGAIAASDFGVLVALVLGLVISAAMGTSAIRKQEKAERE